MSGDARRLPADGESDKIVVVTSAEGPHPDELEEDGDIVVVAAVPTGSNMLHLVERLGVDAAVFQPGRRAEVYQVSRDLRRAHSETAVVLVGAPRDAATLLDAVEAGVRGYAVSDFTPEQVRRVIRAVARGEVAIPRGLLAAMLDLLTERRSEREEALRHIWALTDRERVVLGLLAEARSNDVIARTLRISPQTVRKHVQNVLSKLGVHSRLQAVSYVHRFHLEDQLTA